MATFGAAGQGEMYLRFTIGLQDRDSGRRTGIVQAAFDLRDDGDLSVAEHRALRRSLDWFNANLAVPGCLRSWQNRRALSWFKPTAQEPLRCSWELVEILRSHAVQVDLFKSPDPGIIIYEDNWQVVAKPRHGERRPW